MVCVIFAFSVFLTIFKYCDSRLFTKKGAFESIRIGNAAFKILDSEFEMTPFASSTLTTERELSQLAAARQAGRAGIAASFSSGSQQAHRACRDVGLHPMAVSLTVWKDCGMRIILVFICAAILLATSGCIFPGGRDDRGHSDHGDHGGDHGDDHH